MDADQVIALLHASPFKPFSIVMPSDRAVRVPHPDFVSVAPNRCAMMVWKANGGGQIVDVGSIVELRTGRVAAR